MSDSRVDRVPISTLESRLGIKTAALYERLHALEQLGICRMREGRHVYFPGEHLPLLDELDQHLKAKGTIAEFIVKQGGKLPAQNSGQASAWDDPSLAPEANPTHASNRPFPISLVPHELQKLFPTFWAIGEGVFTKLAAPFLAEQKVMNGQMERLNTNVESLITTVAVATQVHPNVEHLRNHVLPEFERLKAAVELFDSCAQTGAYLATSQIALLLKLTAKTITKQATFQRQGYIFTKVGKEGREFVWKITKAEA